MDNVRFIIGIKEILMILAPLGTYILLIWYENISKKKRESKKR